MRSNRNRSRKARRALRRAALALLLAVAAAPSSGDEAPSFFLERIEVVTEKLSPEIVLSEARLEEGREVDESELREAAHRVQRLPFVLEARMSLARGSERGRYVLRIEVVETRRWFFRFDGDWTTKDDPFRFDPTLPEGGGRLDSAPSEQNALVGRRFAVGRRSLLFATVGGSDGLFALGFQRYGLFGRDAVLSVSVGADEVLIDDGFFDDPIWRGEATLAVPIRGDHAVRLSVDGSHWSSEAGPFSFRRSTATAEAVWVYNSLDDLVLPRTGSLFEAGPVFSWSEGRFTIARLDGRLERVRVDEDRPGVRALGTRWWPIGRRHSLSAGARAYFADTSVAGADFQELEAQLGYQVFLLRQRTEEAWRELRFELEASALSQRAPGFESGTVEVDTTRLRAGLVFRHRWGLYRLFLDYVDRGELR